MKTNQTILASLVMCGWLWGGGAQATITTYLDQNFDSTTVGSIPSGLSTGVTAGTGFVYVTNNLALSSPNSLLLDKGAGGGWTYAIASVPPYPGINSNDTVFTSVSFDLQPKQTTGTLNVLLTNGGTMLTRITFNNIGQISARSSGVDGVVGSYTADSWYHVQLGFWPVYHGYTFQVSTNGTVFVNAAGLGFDNPAINFYQVYFQNYGGDFYIDNLLVLQDTSIVPEPVMAGLWIAGGVVVWVGRKRFGTAEKQAKRL